MRQKNIKLLLGLGNPGVEYHATRHNIGFMVIDALILSYGLREKEQNILTWWGKIEINTQEVIIAKPLTFMNHSGRAAFWLVSEFDLFPHEILIIHDDMDIAWGKMKLVKGGGAGGHKGVLSVQEYLQTIDIPRLKIGIGHPQTDNVINYVLSKFSLEERKDLKIILKQACLAITMAINEGLEKAMSIYNSKNLLEKEG